MARRLDRSCLVALVVVGVLGAIPVQAFGQRGLTLRDVSERVWTSALKSEDPDTVLSPLSDLPEEHPVGALNELRGSFDSLRANVDQRESSRAEKVEAARTELDEILLEEETAFTLSEAIRVLVEIQTLTNDDGALLSEPRVKGIVDRATRMARDAEADGEWLIANELLYRLRVLLEEQDRDIFLSEVERLNSRLDMIQLYTPERFWDLRNEHQVARGEDPLPEYNGLGEAYQEKLEDITADMVLAAIARSARSHINLRERDPVLEEMVRGGLDQVWAMVTTTDLSEAFEGLDDPAAVKEMGDFLTAQRDMMIRPSTRDLRRVVQRLLEVNNRTVQVPTQALLHEFGNGAMGSLDEFSAIIWPDEMRRFERMTQGQFRGVGIQIQLDQETRMIKVVTPLEGTPAQRAGLKRGDLIKRVDGESAIGISLNQAVDRITGPEDTEVTLTVQRGEEDIDFELARAVIKLPSVKGWRRVGAGDDEWDWFIDSESGIGYVRLVSFSDETTDDLLAAISEMQETGLNGLILDLRFNPGGLLTQAVSVANTFIERGEIVSTDGMLPGETRRARPSQAHIVGIPVAVLINEGSASASEIVSGAIRHYSDVGDIRAVLVGQRTFGKGSVQNVWPLTARQQAMLKLTTQYYRLPDGRIIHKTPDANDWGVSPHIEVDMLPEQITEALTIRQDADVLPIDEKGEVVLLEDEDRPDPDKLLDDGIDLQLQTALVLLQSQTLSDRIGTQALLLN